MRWFANANVVDVVTGDVHRGTAIEVAPDGTIAQVMTRAPADAYDIGRRWLLPGLISCHTHLSIVFPFSDTDENESSRLRLPPGGHFCIYALAAVLPLLPAKQRQLPAAVSGPDLMAEFGVAFQTDKGTPDHVAALAQRVLDAGADRIDFGTPHGLTDAEGVALLGRRVLPQLRLARDGGEIIACAGSKCGKLLNFVPWAASRLASHSFGRMFFTGGFCPATVTFT